MLRLLKTNASVSTTVAELGGVSSLAKLLNHGSPAATAGGPRPRRDRRHPVEIVKEADGIPSLVKLPHPTSSAPPRPPRARSPTVQGLRQPGKGRRVDSRSTR